MFTKGWDVWFIFVYKFLKSLLFNIERTKNLGIVHVLRCDLTTDRCIIVESNGSNLQSSKHLADTRHGGIGGIASVTTSPLASRTAGTPGMEVIMFLKAVR